MTTFALLAVPPSPIPYPPRRNAMKKGGFQCAARQGPRPTFMNARMHDLNRNLDRNLYRIPAFLATKLASNKGVDQGTHTDEIRNPNIEIRRKSEARKAEGPKLRRIAKMRCVYSVKPRMNANERE